MKRLYGFLVALACLAVLDTVCGGPQPTPDATRPLIVENKTDKTFVIYVSPCGEAACGRRTVTLEGFSKARVALNHGDLQAGRLSVFARSFPSGDGVALQAVDIADGQYAHFSIETMRAASLLSVEMINEGSCRRDHVC